MNKENDPPRATPVSQSRIVRPDWVPARGHAVRAAGVRLEAVQIRGCLGEEIMNDLLIRQSWDAGPIIQHGPTNEVTFVLAPGTAGHYRWPVGQTLQVMTGAARHRDFIRVPAFGGATWPLLWRSLPTNRSPYVDTAALHFTTGRVSKGFRDVRDSCS